METITGFDIIKRKLSEEEARTEITLGRFNAFHYEAGEDFADSCGHIFNEKIIVGYLICKQPKMSIPLLGVINSKGDLNDLRNVYIDESHLLPDSDPEDVFYQDFAEFLNLTEHAIMHANQILIQVDEYYNQ
jgi:hypothetical protein